MEAGGVLFLVFVLFAIVVFLVLFTYFVPVGLATVDLILRNLRRRSLEKLLTEEDAPFTQIYRALVEGGRRR